MVKTTGSAIDKALEDLIRISNLVGKDTSLVQGGGGNTSVKTADGKYMYIKASGTALKDMNALAGWRKMKVEDVLGIVNDNNLGRLETSVREVEVVNRLERCCVDNAKSGARPSVEAHLHAVLDECVIHLHPVVVGAYVSAKDGEKLIAKLFSSQKFPPLWVPYFDPGFTLGRAVFNLVSDYENRYGRKPQILFLAKHGLFVTSKTADGALKLVKTVIGTLSQKLKQPAATLKDISGDTLRDARLAVRKAVFDATGQYVPVSYFGDKTTMGFVKRKDAGRLLSAGALSPDELVYANGAPMLLEKCDSAKIASKLKTQISKGQKTSATFLAKDSGLFVVGADSAAQVIKDIALSSLFIRANAASLGGVNALSKKQENFINNWESEAFRKNCGASLSAGAVKDRIAIITGAGSGLGRSIAVGLARAGAMVAIADIDEVAAGETLNIIKNEMPKAFVMTAKCNVTSSADVSNSFNAVVERWGGIDIVVNAAGVAPAYALVDLPVEKWRMSLEINLTGYMLMAQAAARIMIKQAMGGSIVNISSKSGLEASKNNTPYNATKAGELHMARGWAMELGNFGIRVNCVAPGNVFEGSKIWNPEYIKVCAKKYGIKPEEVIPYYTNKTSLKREIKGQDIADAVVFLCSDRARTITGQTIVADSGQVMVR